nr:MAG TPA: hypothetical protein [Bacteriophage sp.]
MKQRFSQGGNFTEVWYHEYCLISTKNKNHPDNGKVFRRGLDYQNPQTAGSIFVGQIVGPSSGTPFFQVDTIDNVEKISTKTLEENTYRRYPISQNVDGTVVTNWKQDANGDWYDAGGALKKDFKFNVQNRTLVPGKDGASFNDDIEYTWVNIRKDDEDADSWFYVGMKLPYTVIDYKAHAVSQYDAAGNIRKDADMTSINRIDDKTHPFWEYWDMGIPKGLKGDTLRNLKVIEMTEELRNKVYVTNNIVIDSTTGLATVGKSGYPNMNDDIVKHRQIVVYELYIYDKQINPDPILIYLGDFNIIKNITLDNKGTLTVSYTHNDNTVFEKKIKWVTGVALSAGDGAKGGHFEMTFNNDSPAYTTDLTWVKGLEIQDNGDVIGTFAGTNGGTLANNGKNKVGHIRWISSVTLDENTGHFVCAFNDGTSSVNKYLTWVKDITINQKNGQITLNTTTGDKVSAAKLKLLTAARVNEIGETTLIFNTGETITLKTTDGGENYKVTTVKSIYMGTGISDDKSIYVKYNSSPDPVKVSDPINSIERLVVRPADWHLFVLYSDPSHRVNAATDGWISNNDAMKYDASIPDYGVDVYWKDLGTIKDQAGILVGFNVTKSQLAAAGFTGADIVTYLNREFPFGLTGAQNQPGGQSNLGKIITYQPQDDAKSDKEFYAFDYNLSTWYYLGKIADTGMRDVKLMDESAASYESLKTLTAEGLAFLQNSVTVSDNAIPSYWSSTYKFGA